MKQNTICIRGTLTIVDVPDLLTWYGVAGASFNIQTDARARFFMATATFTLTNQKGAVPIVELNGDQKTAAPAGLGLVSSVTSTICVAENQTNSLVAVQVRLIGSSSADIGTTADYVCVLTEVE